MFAVPATSSIKSLLVATCERTLHALHVKFAATIFDVFSSLCEHRAALAAIGSLICIEPAVAGPNQPPMADHTW